MQITQDTLKKHIGGVQSKFDYTTAEPFVKVALLEFKKEIGAGLYGALPTLSAELVSAAEGCVCWKAFGLALPHLKVRVGDLGMMKVTGTNMVAITKWEYVDTLEAITSMIDQFQEFFWEAIEDEMPEAWTLSPQYRERNSLFLRSASELGTYVPLVGRNHKFYGDLVKFIQRAEALHIRPALTHPVFESLKDRWQDSSTVFTARELELIEKIRFAAGYFTLHEAYPYLPLLVDSEGIRQIRKKDGIREEDIAEKPYRQAQRQQLWQDAQLYLGQLTEFMDLYSSPTFYPEYSQAKLAMSSCDEVEDYTHKSHVLL